MTTLPDPRHFDVDRRSNLLTSTLVMVPSGIPVAGLIGSYNSDHRATVIFGALTGLSVFAGLMLLPMWSLEKAGLRTFVRWVALLSLVLNLAAGAIYLDPVLDWVWVVAAWPVVFVIVVFILIATAT